MTALLATFVEIESPSDVPARVDALGEAFTRAAVEAGGSATRVPCPGAGAAVRVAFPAADPRAAPVVLLGHLDTVCPLGALAGRPFRVEGELGFGPGAFDMKAGLVQGLFALSALRALGRAPRRPVVFLATPDEELGSRASRALVEAEARGAAAALVLEPAAGPSGALKTARKGVAWYRVLITGRAAHAGLDPGKGVNALDELARLVLACHALADPARGTTVSVGVASGGTRANVVPAEASAEVDVRVASPAEAARVDAAFRGLGPAHPEARLVIEGGLNRPPMERSAGTARLFERARIAADQLGLGDLTDAAVGGGSDGNFAAALGVPTLDGLGAVGDGAHAAHEQVCLDRMPERAALLARLLEEI